MRHWASTCKLNALARADGCNLINRIVLVPTLPNATAAIEGDCRAIAGDSSSARSQAAKSESAESCERVVTEAQDDGLVDGGAAYRL